MNYKLMGRFIAKILFVEAAFMIPALVISLVNKENDSAQAFALSMIVTTLIGGMLNAMCYNSKKGFYAKEGFASVAISWFVMSIFGCLPFYLSREIPRFIDALFEIVSGFTTTGASILPQVENLPLGILYWRSFSHWVGGMGVLVLLLAIPSGEKSKGYTMHILRAESPGPDVGKLVPKITTTTQILYSIYLAITVIDFLFLIAGGMPIFDAVCTAFGTAGTGGFGIKNDSIAGYSPYIQNVCTVFMLLFGVNFSCYYMLLLKDVKSVFKDEELRFYLGIVVGCTALIAWNIRGYYDTIEEVIRHSAFQVATIITTTGFATADFDTWPAFSKAIIVILMITGACAGSTGGGFKCGRTLLLYKNMIRNVRNMINPNRVEVVRLNGAVMGEKPLGNIDTYLASYVLIIIVSFLVISLDGFSTTTNLTAVLSCFNNIGPGLEAVGPTCNFSIFSIVSKIVLILDMLAGRLEIFPVLVLFSRSTWKH